MKIYIQFVVSLFLVVGVLVANFVIAQAVEPRYTGVCRLSSNLSISSSGAATCKGTAMLDSGYTADVKVELKRDGTTIKTWTTSGNRTIRISETHYVLSGHNYIVKTSATVYDSNNKVVESPSVDSIEEYY